VSKNLSIGVCFVDVKYGSVDHVYAVSIFLVKMLYVT
jgi:hypothetical protein